MSLTVSADSGPSPSSTNHLRCKHSWRASRRSPVSDAASVAPPHDPYAALRIANYRDYLAGSFLALLGRQAIGVAVTWEIYQWTHSATALGLVGLVNVVPLLIFSLHAGALADRHDRRRLIALGSQL